MARERDGLRAAGAVRVSARGARARAWMDGRFDVVLNQTCFGHLVGEVEVLRDVGDWGGGRCWAGRGRWGKEEVRVIFWEGEG